MAIQGHLSTFSIPELFSFFNQVRKTGTLWLVSEQEERTFVLQNGNLVYASANDPAKRLGSYLVRLGLISDVELQDVVRSKTANESYFGETLVQSSHITKKELQHAVRAQMLDLIEDTLVWRSGAFHFEENELPFVLPGGLLVQVPSILLEVTSKSDERRRARQLIPEGNLVLGVDDMSRLEPERMDIHQKRILQLIDGASTIEQVLFKCPSTQLEAANAVAALLRSGVVRSTAVKVGTTGALSTPELRYVAVSPESPAKLFAAFAHQGDLKGALVEVLSQDPLLTTKLLRSLTLSRVEIPRSLFSIEHFAELVGPFQLRSALLPEAMRGLLLPIDVSFVRECWEHTLLTADLSRLIAEYVQYEYPEEAFVAGLLHNVGIYILLSRDPEKYRRVVGRVNDERGDLELIEEELCGISHTRLGGIYAEKWNFPNFLVPVVKHHHRDEGKLQNTLLHIVSAAARLGQITGVGIEHSLTGRRQLQESLEHAGLTLSAVDELLTQVPMMSVRLRQHLRNVSTLVTT